MDIQEIKRRTFPLIKVISIGLMSGAIGLEISHLSLPFIPTQFWHELAPIFWLGRFAIVAHLLEAIIATLSAASKGKQPLSYGFYTFFVGTVGLIELFEDAADSQTLPFSKADNELGKPN